MRAPPDAERRPRKGAVQIPFDLDDQDAGQRTAHQPGLWDPPRVGFAGQDPPTARSTDPWTSRQAAHSLDRDALGRRCAELLDLIADAGCDGLTVAEIVSRTRYDRGNSARRITDLREQGRIVDSGRTRIGPSGRPSIVWVSPEVCRGVA